MNSVRTSLLESSRWKAWDTVQQALPKLLTQLPRVHAAAMVQG